MHSNEQNEELDTRREKEREREKDCLSREASSQMKRVLIKSQYIL